MSIIDFVKMVSLIPAAGSFTMTIKKTDGTIAGKASDEDDGEGDEPEVQTEALAAPAASVEFVVAASIIDKKGTKSVSLRGSAEELNTHFFEHLGKQVEKLSLTEQMKKQGKEADEELSKIEKDLKAKKAKLDKAKSGAAATAAKVDTVTKPGEKTETAKPAAKEPAKVTAKVEPFDTGSLFTGLGLGEKVVTDTAVRPVASVTEEKQQTEPIDAALETNKKLEEAIA